MSTTTVPLGSLPAERIEADLLLLRLIRVGVVDIFFSGVGLECAFDLHRAGLIRLAVDFDSMIGIHWVVSERGVRR